VIGEADLIDDMRQAIASAGPRLPEAIVRVEHEGKTAYHVFEDLKEGQAFYRNADRPYSIITIANCVWHPRGEAAGGILKPKGETPV
jgi:hypothetical protein